ncbi:sugar nucleotide-binding protein [Desulfococcaceae bacterium HSG9]|nr:sugar nucleotide-binding protein [Desulfococcaceae bacterium HSG9]
MHKNRYIIIGGDSFLGSHIISHLEKNCQRVITTSRNQGAISDKCIHLDLNDDIAHWKCPDDIEVAILCAAITSIDQCRLYPDKSRFINVKQTVALASKLVKQGVFIVFPSTNLIFNGQSPKQKPNDRVSPVTEYGRQKVLTEQRLMTLSPHIAIVRFTKILAKDTSLITNWIEKLKNKKVIHPFEDMVLAPVSIGFATNAIIQIAKHKLSGVSHISASKDITYKQLASYIAKKIGVSQQYIQSGKACNSGLKFEVIPKHTTLDTTRLEKELGLKPPDVFEAIDSLYNSVNRKSDNQLPHQSEVNATCHICQSSQVIEVKEYRNFVRVSSDCRSMPKGGKLGVCQSCGCVQKIIDDDFQSECERIYESYSVYYQAEGEEQRSFGEESGLSQFRSERILSELFKDTTLPKQGTLLDIGCGNGNLLRSFSKFYPLWSLSGSELNNKYKSTVMAIPNVKAFHTCDIGTISDQNDMITMLHCLEHIVDPISFLKKVSEKIKQEGLMLIEVPDFKQNPFDLIIADHCSHFDMQYLKLLLRHAGFEILIAADDYVSKELTFLVRKSKNQSFNDKLLQKHASYEKIRRSLVWLKKTKMKALSVSEQGNLGLFGTSIAGAWLASELGHVVTFFVDEDPSRIGKEFMGRKIYHPDDVPKNSYVFLAFPNIIANKIWERMRHCKANFCLPYPHKE